MGPGRTHLNGFGTYGPIDSLEFNSFRNFTQHFGRTKGERGGGAASVHQKGMNWDFLCSMHSVGAWHTYGDSKLLGGRGTRAAKNQKVALKRPTSVATR